MEIKLHTLKPNEGSTHNSKRLGRGTGSGKGRTSGKGHKGDKARSGHYDKLGFEGGQMPLQRRVPKFGFKNPNRVEYQPVNLDVLNALLTKDPVSVVDFDYFRKHSLVAKSDIIKILGRGEFSSKVEVKAHAFSESAKQAIEKAGGVATVIE